MVAASSAKMRQQLPAQLLAWYDIHGRSLPWRAPAGQISEPYHVWLSEIMLQQTTVKAVIPYYTRFLARWPDIADLAAAQLDDILAEWAGLGYYARARNLHKCAMEITSGHGGRFPDTESELRGLPGVGAYTAAAIAAIAFDRPATPVDGNVERVIARLHAVTDPLPPAKSQLQQLAATLTPVTRPGDYAQGIMDLGATTCTPRAPKCPACPWRTACAGHAAGITDTLPRRRPRAALPTRYGAAFWCLDERHNVLLQRRPTKGMLGGMLEIPTSEWTTSGLSDAPLSDLAPVNAIWSELPGIVRHGFTHFKLELSVFSSRIESSTAAMVPGLWYPVADIASAGLPTLMTKVARHAIEQG